MDLIWSAVRTLGTVYVVTISVLENDNNRGNENSKNEDFILFFIAAFDVIFSTVFASFLLYGARAKKIGFMSAFCFWQVNFQHLSNSCPHPRGYE